MRALLFLFGLIWTSSSAMGSRPDRDARNDDDQRKVRMKLAQCRSTCLAKCWQVCDLLYKNFDIWGHMCGVDNICFPGCKVACSFHDTGSDGDTTEEAASLQPPRLEHDPVEDVVRVTWSPPRDLKGRPLAGALVYVVLLRGLLYQDRWQEVAQVRATPEDSICRSSSPLSFAPFAGPSQSLLMLLSFSSRSFWKVHELRHLPARARSFCQCFDAILPRFIYMFASARAGNTRCDVAFALTQTDIEANESLYQVGSFETCGDHYFVYVFNHLHSARDATFHMSAEFPVTPPAPDAFSATRASKRYRVNMCLIDRGPWCVRFEVVAGCAAALCLLVLACVAVLLVGKLRRSPRRRSSQRPNSISVSTRGVKGVPEKAAHRLDMHSIKSSSRLDFPGMTTCAVHEPTHHVVVQTSGPISPVGESREDLLDEDSSQSNYFVFDLNSSTCNAPRV
ncbi:unnamed protein product [Ixodes hexagonus]